MRLQLVVLFVFSFWLSVQAQTPPRETLDLEKGPWPANLQKDLGTPLAFQKNEGESQILGALFSCRDFCQFLQLVSDDESQVNLPAGETSALRFLPADSPAFAQFFSSGLLKQQEALLLQKNNAKLTSAQTRLAQEKKRSRYAPFFYDYFFGLSLEQSTFKTDSSLQQDLSSPLYGSYLLGGSWVGNTNWHWGSWRWYPVAHLQWQSSLNRKSKTESGLTIGNTSWEASLGFAQKISRATWQADLLFYNETLQVSPDLFSHYGYRFEVLALQLGVFWQDWQLQWAKSGSVTVSETASYRASPAHYDWQRLRLKWTSPRWKVGSLGVAFEMKQFKQNTAASPQLLLNQGLETQETVLGIIFSLEGGDPWPRLLK